MKQILLLICTFLWTMNALAQTNNAVEFILSKEVSLSYTGFNSIWLAGIESGNHQIYAGPKISLNYTYVPSKPVGGWQLGYRYYYLTGESVKSFAAIDYQAFLLKPYNPTGISSRKKNTISELSLSFGVQRKIWKGLHATGSIGIGRYKENYHDLIMSKQHSYKGYNGMVKIGVLYEL